MAHAWTCDRQSCRYTSTKAGDFVDLDVNDKPERRGVPPKTLLDIHLCKRCYEEIKAALDLDSRTEARPPLSGYLEPVPVLTEGHRDERR